MTMLNACAEAHAFAPLRFAHAVEMWYFGSLDSSSTDTTTVMYRGRRRHSSQPSCSQSPGSTWESPQRKDAERRKYSGRVASRSPIRQGGTRTGTTSSTSHPSSNPQRISWLGKFGLKQTAASPHILNATHNHQYFIFYSLGNKFVNSLGNKKKKVILRWLWPKDKVIDCWLSFE